MIELRFKKINYIPTIIMALIAALILVISIIFLNKLLIFNNTFIKDIPDGILESMVIVMIVLMLITNITIVFGIWSLLSRTYRLPTYRIHFTETGIDETFSLMAFKKAFHCTYKEIRQVRRAGSGLIEIITTSNTSLRISLRAFDVSPEYVLEVLEQHIPKEKFDSSVAVGLMRMTTKEKWINAGLFVLAGIYLLLSPISGLILRPNSWRVFHHWGLDDVSSYSIESPNSVWTVTNGVLTNNGKVHHIVDGSEKTWSLPNPKSALTYLSDVIILADKNEQPTVITQEGSYSWQEGKWIEWNFPDEYEAYFLDSSYVFTTDQAWIILREKGRTTNKLIHITGGDNNIDVVPPPPGLTYENYDPYMLSMAPDGTIFVLAGSTILMLKDNQWMDKFYVFERMDSTSVEEDLIPQDITADQNGDIYILLTQFLGDKNVIRKISTDQIQDTWLPLLQDDVSYYETLEVDARGRLWVSSDLPKNMTILKPVWGGQSIVVTNYNENNSNLRNRFYSKLQITQDGRLWANGNKLMWLDSNAEELPAPLPAWLVTFLDTNKFRSVRLGFNILYVLSIIIYAIRVRRPRKK